jgi:ATP-dependent Lon protease
MLAAHRAGLKTVILPKRNKLDLEDIPTEIKKSMTFVFAETVNDVLKAALEKPIRPVRPKETKTKGNIRAKNTPGG